MLTKEFRLYPQRVLRDWRKGQQTYPGRDRDVPRCSWAEQILGKVVKPCVAEHSEHLEWFWFTRYEGPRSDHLEEALPQELGQVVGHVKLRVAFDGEDEEDQWTAFKTTVEHAAVACGFLSFEGDYGFVGDLGGDRFITHNRSGERVEHRAELVARFLHAASAVVLDLLTETQTMIDGQQATVFCLEDNTSRDSPNWSVCESLHHLFCNLSDVQLDAFMFRGNGLLGWVYASGHIGPGRNWFERPSSSDVRGERTEARAAQERASGDPTPPSDKLGNEGLACGLLPDGHGT